ncbi:hypothetical protein FQA39_LY13037 [Lamprigera yunnana]|nr:hypothetical protein FQA39_LY13037 [Lamprigera yunnana]
MVVRFAGGDNAGHMIEFNGKRHKVTIIPSGIFNPKVKNVIDKAARYGIRVCDVKQADFKAVLKENVEYHNEIITKVYNGQPYKFEEVYDELMLNFKLIENNIVDSGAIVADAIEEGQFVLFEGAQGVLLDIDHGTYPYVTSSTCSANNASTGAGVHAKHIQKVVGVAKAYQQELEKVECQQKLLVILHIEFVNAEENMDQIQVNQEELDDLML